MAREFSILVEAAVVDSEWRTCAANHIIEKNKNPVINWTRERPALLLANGVAIARHEKSFQRLYSAVADETLEIHDAAGNLVTVKISGLFEGCAKAYDRWSEEDGEIAD